jgi:hypothetical protein
MGWIRLGFLGALVASLWLAPAADGASLVAKDGQIHACYKAKGKGKGTLRVVRNAKARCPKHWKKTAWYAAGPGGANGSPGENGAAGQTGARGEQGAAGKSENVVVNQLEDKVKSLESILAGISNAQLKEAIAAVPLVGALCTQATALNEQSKGLGESAQALNTPLDGLIIAFAPVTVPTALAAFACPTP